jgi:uncharacterized membrane protein YfcA
MTPAVVIGIGVIAVTVLYSIIRFWEDGNLEKGTLALLLGGTLVGILILYFFYPPFHVFVWNLWYRVLY